MSKVVTNFQNQPIQHLNHLEQPQQVNEEYGDQYEEEFEILQRSNQKTISPKKTEPNIESKGSIKSSNLQQSQNQPPPKQNNWNQKSTNRIQKPEIHQKNDSSLSNNKANDNFLASEEQNQQQQLIENQEPQQKSITLLKNNNSNASQKIKSRNENHKQEQKSIKKEENKKIPPKTKQQLSRLSYQNERQIKELKQKIAEHRNQIKNIGNMVDKDIQKTIVKITKKNSKNINLKHLFNDTIKDDTQSDKLKKLRQQLKNLRQQSKTAKSQITNIQTKLSDPVNKQNTLKYQQIQVKYKLLSQQTDQKIKQKQLMQEQLNRMKQGLNFQEQEHFQKSLQKNQQQLNKFTSEIKEERAKLYKQQKNDIQLMQKLKFFVQNDQRLVSQIVSIQSQKSLGESKISQQELKNQINLLLKDINQILEERNKTENQKYKLMRNLQNQVESFEASNVKILNQIRNVDSSLLQYYTHKASKKTSSISKPIPKTAEKLHQTIDSGSPLLRQKNIDKNFQINDKNMVVSSTSSNKFRSKIQAKKYQIKDKSQITVHTQQFKENQQENHYKMDTEPEQKSFEAKSVEAKSVEIKNVEPKFVEVKSVIHFGDLKVDEKGAILSDQILGKVKIREIHIFVDNKSCYGIHCKYFNHQKDEIIGMKICEKNADEKTQKISLILDTNSNEYITNVKVGYSIKNQIKHFEIQTSKHQQLKWTVQNQVSKSDSKALGKYESISIKAKLISSQQIPNTSKSLNELMNQKPKLKIAGIGFSVIELKKQQQKLI